MDSSLFLKYKTVIDQKTKQKEEIITFVKEEYNYSIPKEAIQIQKNILKLSLPSVIRMKFVTNTTKEKLKTLGYTMEQ
jgi:hypothetical protein